MKRYLIIGALLVSTFFLALGLSRLEGYVLPIHPFGNSYYIKRVPYLSSLSEKDLEKLENDFTNELGE
jgi:hypothetical protein